jgi:hypothetical protein
MLSTSMNYTCTKILLYCETNGLRETHEQWFLNLGSLRKAKQNSVQSQFTGRKTYLSIKIEGG